MITDIYINPVSFNTRSNTTRKKKDTLTEKSVSKQTYIPQLKIFSNAYSRRKQNGSCEDEDEVYDLPDSDYDTMEEEEAESLQMSIADRRGFDRDVKIEYYDCKKCYFISSQKEGLDFHMEQNHLDDETNDINVYSCIKQACIFTCTNKKEMDEHVESFHKNRRKDIKCKLCDYNTNLMGNMNRHVRNKHFQKQISKSDVTREDANDNDSSIAKYHKHDVLIEKCPYCDYGTAIKITLDSHIQSEHFKIDTIRARPTNWNKEATSEKSNIENDDQLPLSLSNNSGAHSSYNNLSSLAANHNPNSDGYKALFSIDDCPKGQEKAIQAKPFDDIDDEDSDDFICDQCRIKFRNANEFNSHLNKLHTTFKK